MMTLGVDTTSSKTSLAVLRDDEIAAVYDEQHEHPPSDASFVLLENMLDEVGIQVGELDVFAACIGPGSFTGLRIGLGMAKTLGWACQRPVIGLDAVEIAARRAVSDGTATIGTGFMVCVPGFKKTIFIGRYTWDGHVLSRTGELEWVDGMDELQEKTRENEPIFVPETSELQFPGTTPVSDDVPAAVILAREAARRIGKNELQDFESIQPLYLKPFSVGRKAGTMKDMR